MEHWETILFLRALEVRIQELRDEYQETRDKETLLRIVKLVDRRRKAYKDLDKIIPLF